MLNTLDNILKAVLDRDWGTSTKPGFYFEPPDEGWSTKTGGSADPKLNIYLYEVTENRNFRRAEWDVIEQSDHSYVSSHPPVYFDCHYLLSAWSPITETETASAVLEEHGILSDAIRVILRNPDVSPAALGIVDGGTVLQQAHIYLTVASPETPRVLNDFWSTMKQPWRLAVPVIITAPLDLLRDAEPAPMVTTFIQRYANIASTTVDERIQIGGMVVRDDNGLPLLGAKVQRRSVSGNVLKEIMTDSQGRYSFAGLNRGNIRLHVEAAGMTAIDRNLSIPDGVASDYIFRLKNQSITVRPSKKPRR